MGLGALAFDESMQQQFMVAMQAMSNHPLMVSAMQGGVGGGPAMPPPELLQGLMDNIILKQQRRQQLVRVLERV